MNTAIMMILVGLGLFLFGLVAFLKADPEPRQRTFYVTLRTGPGLKLNNQVASYGIWKFSKLNEAAIKTIRDEVTASIQSDPIGKSLLEEGQVPAVTFIQELEK